MVMLFLILTAIFFQFPNSKNDYFNYDKTNVPTNRFILRNKFIIEITEI